MTIQEKRDIIEEQTIHHFKWELDKSQMVHNIKTITLSYHENLIVFDCHELKKSQEILNNTDNHVYYISKEHLIKQICTWIRERVNQRIIDFNLKNFEIIYRWNSVNILSDKY